MDKIYEVLLIMTAAIGFYASFVLLFVSKQNSLLNRLFALYWVTISLFAFLTFCIIQNWTPNYIVLIRTFMPLYYFLPATCYLYYRTYIQDDTQLKKKDLLNLIPLALNLIYTTPLIYSLLMGKIQWEIILGSVDKQFFFFNYGPIPDRFHVFMRLVVMLFYVYLVLKLHFSKNYQEFATKNQTIYPISIRWINFYIYTITIFATSAALRQITLFFFSKEKNLVFDYLIRISTILCLDVMILFAIINPVILFGLPHFQFILDAQFKNKNDTSIAFDNDKLVQPNNEILANSTSGEINTKSTINTETEIENFVAENEVIDRKLNYDYITENDKINILLERITDYIEKVKPYREVDFNILMLSKALQVPQHHIIYIFKIVLKKSFVDFRNELRIKYVLDAIKTGKLKHLTMEAISNEAGFASRTTFYAVFKKHVGITPGQYLNELGIEN
jgi:AraC-like DNA-binding protein